jgi:hypothetical protein
MSVPSPRSARAPFCARPVLRASRTCIPDLPGAGETRWTEQTDLKFGAQAETLRRFIDGLGLTSCAMLAHVSTITLFDALPIADFDGLPASASRLL